MAPDHGSYPSKTWCAIPVPRVSVRNWVRKPISPRAGTTNSSLTQPVPWLVIDSIRPRRTEISEVTVPRYSSGTSTDSRSTGSQTSPPAAPGAPPGVGPLGRQHVQRHVAAQLGVEPVADQPGGDLGRGGLPGQRR